MNIVEVIFSTCFNKFTLINVIFISQNQGALLVADVATSIPNTYLFKLDLFKLKNHHFSDDFSVIFWYMYIFIL